MENQPRASAHGIHSHSTGLAQSCKLQRLSRKTWTASRDITQPLAQQGGYWSVPVEDSGGCILFWQLEALCNGLLTLPSPHTFQFPSTPRRVQFANRNPLFYLKLGVPGCYPLGRKLPLWTAVGAKFDYSVARTKVCDQPRTWIPREGPFACLHELPAALSAHSESQE